MKSLFIPFLTAFSLGGVISVSTASSAQAAMIIVDFDVLGGSTGTNWNQMLENQILLPNLVDVTGQQTGFMFMRGDEASTPPPPASEASIPSNAMIPVDSPITTDIGGLFTATRFSPATPTSFWFKNLEPGSEYYVYIFSFRGDQYYNQVTVTTENTLPDYEVSGNNVLYVNDELGTNTRTLSSYRRRVRVWTEGEHTGEIGFIFNVGSNAPPFDFNAAWAIAAIAIEPVSDIPEPSLLLGLGMMGGWIGLQNQKKRKNKV